MSTLIEDTIAAISTPAGRGGIGVIRLSGPRACQIIQAIIPPQKILIDRQPVLCQIHQPGGGARLDQAILTLFAKPRSYTAEDLVEISCHGSPVVLRAILAGLIASGARLAQPGEFTQRAFLNGRIDLLQAEAIRDLIEAKTLYQAKIAHQQISGSLSRIIKPVKNRLVDLISALEAGIDFADDDVEVMPSEKIDRELQSIGEELAALIKGFQQGRMVEEGLTIAILGRPNVGKSSLFNALLSQDRAIVTDLPGTTRDVISEGVQIRGIPLRLLDTAGIREAGDRVEQIGMEKTEEALADADQLLLVLDGSTSLSRQDQALWEKLAGRPFHIAINKSDLRHQLNEKQLPLQAQSCTWVSALTGGGIDQLKDRLIPKSIGEGIDAEEGGLVTHLRQQQWIEEAYQKVIICRHINKCNNPHEILLLELYGALKALNALTGETTVEDILGNIFSHFCIGK
jgi:tRNA modification GTPase